MKDDFAAFRTLILPYGATSGPYIVLDGVNGRILVYNADDDLIAWMAPVDGVDEDGTPYYAGVGMNPYDSSFPSSAFRTSVSLEANNGRIRFAYNPVGAGPPVPFIWDGEIRGFNPNGIAGDGAALFLAAPSSHASGSFMQVEMRSVSANGAEVPMVDIGPEAFSTSVAIANSTEILTAGIHYRKTKVGGNYVKEVWNALPGNNGYAGGSYKMLPDGNVMLDGNVAGGVAGSPIAVATLPVGYRPRANVERVVSRFGVGPGLTNKITINAATGVINAETPDATYNSWLSGIVFSTVP